MLNLSKVFTVVILLASSLFISTAFADTIYLKGSPNNMEIRATASGESVREAYANALRQVSEDMSLLAGSKYAGDWYIESINSSQDTASKPTVTVKISCPGCDIIVEINNDPVE